MRKTYIFSAIITILLFSSVFHSEKSYAGKSPDEETMRLLDKFGDVFEKIREEYVEEPSDKELVEAAINGMLTDLDPHSSYLTKKDFEEMQVQTRGKFGGLGIEVTMRNGMVYIVSPIDDTPAFRAGIEAGDYFSHLDGESVLGMTINDAINKMRGKAGEKIVVTIIREGADEPFDVDIIRDIITIKSVKSRAEDDVAYIRITTFSEQTEKGLYEQLKKLKVEIGSKLKGVVLDLRNNPGGLLNQAIAVSDAFLDRGEIVSTRGRHSKSAKKFSATRGDIINGLPIVVLINGGSASASEIVAGALQDHKRAILMGTKSFGKGSVQTIIPLPEDSAIRITTSKYYTPSGKSIQAEGINPDIIVELANLEFVKKGRRTTEASLRGHLKSGVEKEKEKNKNKKKSTENSDKDKIKEKIIKKIDDAVKNDEKESLYKTDYQLARALDLLRGIYIYSGKEAENILAAK